ncbi:unnamed protein product (macronuclear) [Paramecium tetraurelia]|uniref:Helicase ATP-binding domain-containing protein n=1 Tax=Paramecium tetraurelia TaxID=5888 RepID=A0DS52_PARTE|nr:uncharacterized protein GSPATT00019573001 [Paramecium tetraurelia]CAK85869.1 unnamed protein product [Paramecium tetraurelia]|eukprot:XP_001453266.1 hypothetical protein (macronuclear) [Paramecium tetraurelia strain d4-2]
MDSVYQQYTQPIWVLMNEAFYKAVQQKSVQNLNGFKYFESIKEYQDLIFPLLQNEAYHSLRREQLRFLNNLKDRSQYPLVFEVILNQDAYRSKGDGVRFDVLREYKIMKDESPSKNEFWKYNRFAQYLIFNQSQQYFGAVYSRNPNKPNEYFTSLAIYSNKQGEQQLILPYTKYSMDMFKFKNIITADENLNFYKSFLNDASSNIWDQKLLVYFSPISPLSAYINETETIFNLQRCPFYKLLLDPCQELNQVQISDFSEKVRVQQELYFNNQIYTVKFNAIQLQAIRHALDFTKRITIIKGPPGTGKTQTTIGIISIMADLLIKAKDNDNPQGCILVLAKSNSVVNDLVRKITDSIEKPNSIIYCFNRKPDYLKILRFGRPEKCDKDIQRLSLEIRSQNHFFQYKVRDNVRESYNRCITPQIISELEHHQLQEFKNYLIEKDEQFTLISLLSYIEELNFRTRKQKILEAYGKLYNELSQLLKQKRKVYEEIEQQYLDQCHIIVSTLNSCSKLCLEQYFDKVKLRMCIIDEAPTALEPSLLIPFVKYRIIEKVVLLGDIKQLNPIVIANESINYGYNRSLFQRLAIGLKNDSLKLIHQYRQIPNLAEITSELFYKNQLKNGIQDMQFPEWIKMKVSQTRNRLFFNAPAFTESNEETSKKNELECQAIILLTRYLLQGQNFPNNKKPITIISAYRAQTDNIFKKLQQEKLTQENNQIHLIDQVELDTVDSFQGKENDIIILSLVRSNDKQGFLKDKKRANVALSRAKYCQYIFGTKYTMKLDLRNWNRIIKKLEDKNPLFFENVLMQQ